MGIETWVYAVVAGIGTAQQVEARRDAKAAQRYSQEVQKQQQSEQRAANAAEAARERRTQLREERVRRARVLQSAENTGTEGSSGELGALSSISTQLASNIGTNLGRMQTAENMSIFAQMQADAQGGLQNAERKQQTGQFLLNNAGTFGDVSGSIFQTKTPN